ncbi:MAG: hypothetical protein GY882_01730 [Actinomycetia bacterium]|nr:hypothetical protein [Actinomycetes bacterium]MCP4844891.1 hypothetical protein [Actinomycetes bacterium]
MLELALAAVIFAVVAGMLITGLGQAFGARIATSATGQVHEWLENAADELANGDFTELLEGEFTAPEPCDGDTQTSCFEVLGRQFTATWDVAIADGAASAVNSVTVTGTTSVADRSGDVPVSTVRRVTAPSSAFRPGFGAVRVVVTDDRATSTGTQLFLVKVVSPSTVLAAATVLADGSGSDVEVLQVAAGHCTDADPCALVLQPDSTPLSDGSTGMTGGGLVDGLGIVVDDGGLADTEVRLFDAGTITVMLVDSAGSAPTTASTVCLYAAFRDAGTLQEAPVCNDVSADRIVFADYTPEDHGFGVSAPAATRVPLPAAVAVSFAADRTDSVCEHHGQLAAVANDMASTWKWERNLATCGSWTWGSPETLTTTGPAEAFEDAIVEAPAGTNVTVIATWASSSPAGGWDDAGISAWSAPRYAQPCATEGTCVGFGSVIPEDVACTVGDLCFSHPTWGSVTDPDAFVPGSDPVASAVAATIAGAVHQGNGYTATVVVTDATSALMAGVEVALQAALDDAGDPGLVSATATCITDAAGQCDITVAIDKRALPGTHTLTFGAQGTTGTTTTVVNAAAHRISIQAPTAAAVGVAGTWLATVEDGNGNALAGAVVEASGVATASATTAADGVAGLVLTPSATGSLTFAVTSSTTGTVSHTSTVN